MALYFPKAGTAWETTHARTARLSPVALNRACTYARSAGTRQLVVLYRGRIVRECYFDSEPGDTFDVFAVQKSVFAVLFGVIRDRGLVDVETPLNEWLHPGWSHVDLAVESRLTMRHVLTMTTGMDDTLAPHGEPGTTWHYNNVVYNILKQAFCRRVKLDLDALTFTCLGCHVGFERTGWTNRNTRLANGQPVTALRMNARDLARFGLAMLAHGRFDDREIVRDVRYLEACLEPGSAENPAWGYMWWLNGRTHYRLPFSETVYPGALMPEAPADLFAARGANEQRLYVIPSRELVVVRLGEVTPASKPFDQEFLRRLLAA
jgi:CubicO group peptidase (beta-lactamase class C family)